jgi:lysylphosphatidylglycerol synthetase-like protein (DUF2156 family)
MPAEEQDRPVLPARRWTSIATLLGVVSAVGGVLLHLIGVTVNETYFKQWGLDAAMFPKPTDMTLVQGYYALVNGISKIVVTLIAQHWPWLLAYGLFLGPAAWLSTVMDTFPRTRLAGWIAHHERLARIVVMFALGLGIVAVVMPLVLVTVVVVLALPISAGNQYGKTLVQEQLDDFKGGCERSTSKAKCVSLMKGEQLLARGFLIAATQPRVAIYDPAAKRTIVLETEGLTLNGAPNRLADPPDGKASDAK